MRKVAEGLFRNERAHDVEHTLDLHKETEHKLQ